MWIASKNLPVANRDQRAGLLLHVVMYTQHCLAELTGLATISEWSSRAAACQEGWNSLESTNKGSQSRSWHNWHTRWICAKALLVIFSTWSSSKSWGSRRMPKIVYQSWMGKCSSTEIKGRSLQVGPTLTSLVRIKSVSVLPQSFQVLGQE